MSATSKDPKGLRVAVIGMGRMGIRHLQAVRRLGMDVCGVVDNSAQALDDARTQHGVRADACFVDAVEMLDAVRPEALVVSTTAPTHACFVVAAAERGVRYILCEKPMATSLEECDRMSAACARSGTLLAVNHQMRFMPQYTEARALVTSEGLGGLSSMVVAGSNFGLAMNASHYFEAFRYVTGEQVTAVQAWFESAQLANPRGPQFEDRSGRLKARNSAGQVLYIDFSAAAGHGLQVIYICRYGQVMVDELTGDVRIAARKPEFRQLPTTRYGMPADVAMTTISEADTVVPTIAVWNSLLAGEAYPDAAMGAQVMSCLVAAHASHESGGREVGIDESVLLRSRVFKWA